MHSYHYSYELVINNQTLTSHFSFYTQYYDHVGPAMRLLHEAVIPRIAAYWSIVADYLEYEVETKKLIRDKYHDDPIKCCVELLEDWLSSDRGVTPKSWSRLIEALKGIRSLTVPTEMIIQDLAKAGVVVTE